MQIETIKVTDKTYKLKRLPVIEVNAKFVFGWECKRKDTTGDTTEIDSSLVFNEQRRLDRSLFGDEVDQQTILITSTTYQEQRSQHCR